MRIAALVLAGVVGLPALASPNASQQVGPEKDELICKRETPVGSLIATRKICLTKAQWERRIEDGNRETRKLMEDGTTRQMSN